MKSVLLLITIAYMSGCIDATIFGLSDCVSLLDPLNLLSNKSNLKKNLNLLPKFSDMGAIQNCIALSNLSDLFSTACIEQLIVHLLRSNVLPESYFIKNITESLSNQFFNGVISLSNVTIHGLNNLRLLNVSVRTKSSKIYMSANFTAEGLGAEGNINGNLVHNGINLTPDGTFNVKSDVTAVRTSILAEKLTHGPPYIHYIRFHPQINPRNLYIHATGLSPDAGINAIVVQVLSQHWRTIYTEGLIKEKRKQWISYWTDLANQIASEPALIHL